MPTLFNLAIYLINVFGVFFLAAIVVFAIACVVMWIQDRLQRQHAVRRNFPVLGRFRYGIENLGPYLRQYLFDTDRGLLPFNRAERSWVYRAAKNLENTVAFGSTLDLTEPGTI
ncbi:MAG TPA: FMN-binding glutamate synthase family protein, partial [Spongiibacteraceae bacterium]|nr:FMN-binding glutamate synthase family protein [Spongiibacteraceae bacterium]